MPKKYSFEPVLGRAPRILILGSLPGEASLRLGQYYGHPQNRFWELVGEVLGINLRNMAYDERLEELTSRGVALWDVVAHAYRNGSLDTNIRNEKINPVTNLILENRIKAVFFNGKKAANLFLRSTQLPSDVVTITLPSSSPANASVSWPKKRQDWSQLSRYL
jgi:hypoxanthine-DNA glycosylase